MSKAENDLVNPIKSYYFFFDGVALCNNAYDIDHF